MTMSNLAYDATVDGGDTSPQDIAAMQALRPVPRISIQAFCETEGVANPVERAGEDRRMTKAHLKVHMGGVRHGHRVLSVGADAEPDPAGVTQRTQAIAGAARPALGIL